MAKVKRTGRRRDRKITKKRMKKVTDTVTLSLDNLDSGGKAGFKLTKDHVNKVYNFIKPYSNVVTSVMVAITDDNDVVFGQNQDGVLGVLIFSGLEFTKMPEKPFSFMITRDLVSNIKSLIKSDIEVVVDGNSLDIILGGTDLAMLTSEDEHPDIDINLDLSKVESLPSDILKEAISRVSVIKTSGIGTIFPVISIGEKVLGGSDIFFTEVSLGTKFDKVFNIPQEFMPFFQTVVKDGYKPIYLKEEDNSIVVSDGELFYMTRKISETFPASSDMIKNGRELRYSATMDKRSLAKVVETLDVVLTGVTNPYVVIETSKKKELVFKAVSLGGRTSFDSVKVVDVKGDLYKKPVKVKSYFLHGILKGNMDNVLNVNVYDDFMEISDEVQSVIFALMSE